MNDLRFILTAAAVFAAAFGTMWLVSPWASKGLAVIATSSPPAKPAPAASPAIGETNPGEDKAAAAVQQPVSAPTPEPEVIRGHLAQSALLAANAYARAPCDPMAKAAFIVAASSYLRASPQASKDTRVHEAIKTAFESGHVGSDEFPPDTMFAGRSSASMGGCINSADLR